MTSALAIWLAIGSLGLLGSLTGLHRWTVLQQANRRSGLNGARGFLVAGRVMLWRLRVVSFVMWIAAGLLSLTGIASIVTLLLFFGGFALFAATMFLGNWYDDHLERML